MSKAVFNIEKFAICIILIALFIFIKCTDDQPLTTESVEQIQGSIAGTIKPDDAFALIEISQGTWIDSTYSDSATGYFRIDSLEFGAYTLQITAKNYGKYIRNEVEINSKGIKYLGDIYLKNIPEQLQSIIPSEGTDNIPLTSPCGFEFTTSMDHSSVENNFAIAPSIDYYFQWIENKDIKAAYIHPVNKFRAGTKYTFILNTGAKTIYGDTLAFQVSSNFTTEPVKIISYSPENGASYISPETTIFFTFNSNMIKTTVENAFSISNSVSGRFIWHNDESFSFKPDLLFATNQTYNVYLTDEAEDIYGKNLKDDFSLTFKTEPLRVTSTYPSNGATNIKANSNIQIIFNSNVDQQSAESAFSISPNVVGYIEWTDQSKFTFYPVTGLLTKNTEYLVKINTNCKDFWGSPLLDEHYFQFTTEIE